MEWFHDGGRIPRKTKKRLLGELIKKTTLRKMLSETTLGEPIRTMFERREILPHGEFCPKCGTKGYVGTGNKTCYPEHWEYFHCIRCRSVVGYIDNSPFVHALECAEDNYNPIF